MITDPTELFKVLARRIDGETGLVTDLPKATTEAIYDLLKDDQPDEDTQVRGMMAIAAERLEELDNLVIVLRRILYWNGKRVIHGPNVSMLGREYIEICNLLEKLP